MLAKFLWKTNADIYKYLNHNIANNKVSNLSLFVDFSWKNKQYIIISKSLNQINNSIISHDQLKCAVHIYTFMSNVTVRLIWSHTSLTIIRSFIIPHSIAIEKFVREHTRKLWNLERATSSSDPSSAKFMQII